MDMDEEMNLSLDEIIRKRKVLSRQVRFGDGPAPRGPNVNGARGFRSENGTNRRIQRPVVDARMKIIQNKRAKMRDAREQLVGLNRNRDARFRLQNQRSRLTEGPPHAPSATSTNGRNSAGSEHLKMKQSKRRYAQPECMPQYAEISSSQGPMSRYSSPPNITFMDDQDEEDLFDRMDLFAGDPSLTALAKATRILHNDAFTLPSTMPPLPHFRTVRATSTVTKPNNGTSLMNFPPPSISSDPDPFDQYEVNRRPDMNVPPPPLPLNRPLRSILRTRPSTPPPPSITTNQVMPLNLSPSMRARLERAPNPNKSMGIFAHSSRGESPTRSYRNRSPSPPPMAYTAGYRIVVSNLHPSVSQIDIKELFEDIGDLLESRLVRPGVAEVIYRNLKDAEKAVDAYHNRQLDGQPMNCLLVNPRASYKLSSPNVKYSR
uniref:RRM domain-containing protein n=1 Tax=Anopheles culicifacies TaxID=139723 RepID=A0A182LXX9_9DIPT